MKDFTSTSTSGAAHEKPRPSETSTIGSRRIIEALWQSAIRFRRTVLQAMGLMIGSKLAAIVVPLLLKYLLDGFSSGNSATNGGSSALVLPIFLVLAYALLRFMSDALGELRDVVFSIVAQQTVAEFTERTFAQLHCLGARYHSARETGTIIRDVERGANAIGYLLGSALFSIIPTLIEMGTVIAILTLHFSGEFAVVIALTFATYSVHTSIFTRRRLRHQRLVNELEAKTDSRIVDSLINHDAVKYYAAEKAEQTRLSSILNDWIRARLDNQNSLSVLHVGQSAVVAAGICAVMLLSLRNVINGIMTVGDFVLVNAYIVQICMPLNMLGAVFREAQDAMVNVERMFSILDTRGTTGEDIDTPNAQPLVLQESRTSASEGAEIRFQDVEFSYDVGRPILRGVDITVARGETVAIVGGSGSGKSTLMRLLFRLYQPTAGTVLISGQNLRNITQRSLREAIGIVPQETVLFNETIAYNIGYGLPGASRADIVRAARAAQLDHFIDQLPDHYETRVGERGVRLSGGERQRIAIARAILKDPPIVVFDEATSALDVHTERAIQTELDQLSKGRTSIVIAHRLATVVGADRILVMEHGKLVEQGTHEALIRTDGVYAKMWSLQRQQNELYRAQSRLTAQTARLGAVIDGILELLHDAFSTGNPDFYTICNETDSAARVVGDIGTLQRIVVNLCQREIDASKKGERIELRADVDGHHAHIGVYRRSDAPADVSAAEALLMENEVSAAGASLTLTSRKGRLGYAVAVPIRPANLAAAPCASSPSGMLAARNVIPDRTVNATTHPSDPATELPPPPPGQPDPHPQSLDGIRIIIIDDEANVRDALSAALEANNARVSSYARGGDALAFLRQVSTDAWPDILLCDIVLDGEDGYAILRQLRQLEEHRQLPLEARVPALAITGQTQPEDRVRTLAAGFQSHIGKPVSVPRLIAIIRMFVSERATS